jgi:hypothetical protein
VKRLDSYTFNVHINNIVSIEQGMELVSFLEVLSRAIVMSLLLRRAFLTFVRPSVEYNTVVWNPV